MMMLLLFSFLHVTNDVIQSYVQAMPSPDPIIEPLLVQAEFSDVAKLGQVKIDNALVIALVERWRPASHTFHLPVGECTITLKDVDLQLGLSIDDRPITGPTYSNWEQTCTKYIGVVPKNNALKGLTLKLKWLKEHMLTVPVKPTQQQLAGHCRAYILRLIGGVVMPNKL